MKKYIIAFIIAMLGIFGFNFVSANTDTYAVNICNQSGVSKEVKRANGCEVDGEKPGKLSDTIVEIVNRVVGALGVVAVIFIVVGGINYMTSTGDPGKVKKAKDTILYAAIGLIICALAFAIVNFVIAKILK